MRKRAWVELEAPPEKQTLGRSEAGPGLLSQPMGLVSARAFWLGFGGSFARFKFAAHAVADAPTRRRPRIRLSASYWPVGEQMPYNFAVKLKPR